MSEPQDSKGVRAEGESSSYNLIDQCVHRAVDVISGTVSSKYGATRTSGITPTMTSTNDDPDVLGPPNYKYP